MRHSRWGRGLADPSNFDKRDRRALKGDDRWSESPTLEIDKEFLDAEKKSHPTWRPLTTPDWVVQLRRRASAPSPPAEKASCSE
jgi:hypothetical protein